MKIMVVDDSPIIRNIVKQALSLAGYSEFLEAGDGVECLEAAKAGISGIGLFIVDVNMPNMDGITLVGELRKLTQDTPIVILTTETEREKMEKGKAAGATGWIVKPFKDDKFIEVVKMLLK